MPRERSSPRSTTSTASSLGTADQVSQLHEVLCFWLAYPDNERVLA